MKTIGMLGGMSWESSLDYYRIVNQTVKARLGGLHSAQCLMYSFDFAEIEVLQMAGDWEAATRVMVEAAQDVERGGADCLIICTNTMHMMADAVQDAIGIPLIHIADPTAEKILADGLDMVALLGTAFTMEEEFYRGRLADRYGLKVLIPDEAGRKVVHDVIYDELVLGILKDESRRQYKDVIGKLAAQGAQAVILGCTEIGQLVKPADSPIPTYDTTQLHAVAAVDWALNN